MIQYQPSNSWIKIKFFVLHEYDNYSIQYPQDDSENFFHEYTEAIMTQPKTNTLIKVSPDSAAIER